MQNNQDERVVHIRQILKDDATRALIHRKTGITNRTLAYYRDRVTTPDRKTINMILRFVT